MNINETPADRCPHCGRHLNIHTERQTRQELRETVYRPAPR